MDRTQQRFERFAQLRAANHEQDYEAIMAHIHDEEIEQDEAEHYQMIDGQQRERDEQYTA